jgi:hypothetical protein
MCVWFSVFGGQADPVLKAEDMEFSECRESGHVSLAMAHTNLLYLSQLMLLQKSLILIDE